MALLPTDYPPGYAPGEVKLSKNLIGSAKGKFGCKGFRLHLDDLGNCINLLCFLFVVCLFVFIFSPDVILNMVSNIAVNVLGGGPEMQGMTNTDVSAHWQLKHFIF